MEKYFNKYSRRGLPNGANEQESFAQGFIVSERGQWDFPYQPTRVPGSNMTMMGVPYPVLGIGSTGQQQMMYPGGQYSFPGSIYVDELPIFQTQGEVKPVKSDLTKYWQKGINDSMSRLAQHHSTSGKANKGDVFDEFYYAFPKEHQDYARKMINNMGLSRMDYDVPVDLEEFQTYLNSAMEKQGINAKSSMPLARGTGSPFAPIDYSPVKKHKNPYGFADISVDLLNPTKEDLEEVNILRKVNSEMYKDGGPIPKAQMGVIGQQASNERKGDVYPFLSYRAGDSYPTAGVKYNIGFPTRDTSLQHSLGTGIYGSPEKIGTDLIYSSNYRVPDKPFNTLFDAYGGYGTDQGFYTGVGAYPMFNIVDRKDASFSVGPYFGYEIQTKLPKGIVSAMQSTGDAYFANPQSLPLAERVALSSGFRYGVGAQGNIGNFYGKGKFWFDPVQGKLSDPDSDNPIIKTYQEKVGTDQLHFKPGFEISAGYNIPIDAGKSKIKKQIEEKKAREELEKEREKIRNTEVQKDGEIDFVRDIDLKKKMLNLENRRYRFQDGGATTPEEWEQEIRAVESQIGNPSGWTLQDYNLLQNKLNDYRSWRENTPEGQAVIDSHNVEGEYNIPLPEHLRNYTNAMMKARLAYANEFGNPAAQRIIVAPDQPYDFGDGYTGTHYMSSINNYAVPQIQDENGQLVLGDYGPESNEAIRFDNPDDAQYFAEHYKEVSPGFMELELTDDEIEQYVKGGYVVEELPKAQVGGEEKDSWGRSSNSIWYNFDPEKKQYVSKDAWGRPPGSEWYGFDPESKKWTLGNKAAKQQEDALKQRNEETIEFYKQYMNSPRYKEMLGFEPMMDAQRKANFGNTSIFDMGIGLPFFETEFFQTESPKVTIENYQPKDKPTTGGYSKRSTGNIFVLPKGYNVKGLLPHEWSHSIDRPVNGDGERLIPQKDIDYIEKTTVKDEDILKTPGLQEYSDYTLEELKRDYPEWIQDEIEWKNYVATPTEVRARLNDIRLQSKERKLYDPFTQKVTPEIYEKLKNTEFETGKEKGFDALKQLKGIYTDEQIMYMLNNISQNTPSNNTIDYTNENSVAKLGGAKYKQGGSIKYNIGDEVDEATMKELEKLGYTFEEI